MLANINFQIWFRVCKPIKVKYMISTNSVMVLNGSYVLYRATNQPFTRRQLRDFCKYYNNRKIDYYISVLIDKEMIALAGVKATRQLYTISELGIQVINELVKSYDEQLYLFCSKYNIEL
jgi:flavorubredoxin